jgi:RNA recognition motif-containing protein
LSTDSCGSSDLRATHASNNQEQRLFIPLDAKQDETRTTVMVRNIPTSLSQTDFVTELMARGYRGLFRFVYMPMNLRSNGSFGYAFVDFCSPAFALQLMEQLELLEDEDKDWRAVWSRTQGITANVEFYRNSPLMHETIPEDCKPALYDEHGVQVPFPAPTKYISKPRIHHSTIKSMKKEQESRDAVAKVATHMCGSKHEIKPSQNRAGRSKHPRPSLTINVKHEC